MKRLLTEALADIHIGSDAGTSGHRTLWSI
jgi:hypothetical protein